MYRIVALMIALSFCPSAVFAQATTGSISGVVVDATSGLPLSSATVSTVGPRAASAPTDAAGRPLNQYATAANYAPLIGSSSTELYGLTVPADLPQLHPRCEVATGTPHLRGLAASGYDSSMSDITDAAASIPTIGLEDVRAHVEANDIFLLDVRRSAHGGQIYGAIRYDPKKLRDAERLILPLPKNDGLVVLYDEDGTSDALLALAAKVRDNGYGTVRVLAGGFHAWKAADGKTEEATLEQPVPLVSGHQISR